MRRSSARRRKARSGRKLIAAALFAAICLGAPSTSESCAFHSYIPERTVVDWLLDSDAVVLARAAPENPFRFVMTAALRGDPRMVDLPELVDSTTRHKLALSPTDAVMFARATPASDWQRLAYLDDEYRRVVDAVMSGMDLWQPGYDPARLQLFAALHDHPDPRLRNLALMELDRAPYHMLRTLAGTIDAVPILADLWTLDGVAFVSIRVLLLGMSDAEQARHEIRDGIERNRGAAWSKSVGAFATALIELDGVSGVDRLAFGFLDDAGQPLDKLELIVEALAIQRGSGGPELGRHITRTLARAVGQRPDIAPLVARQFASRGDWSQAEYLKETLRLRRLTVIADLMTVSSYVAMALRPDGVTYAGQ